MATLQIEVDEDLLAVLRTVGPDRPPAEVARELIVLELYRRREVSSGWAAKRLGMDRFDFIPWSGELGIPYIDMTEEEWAAELRTVEEMVREYRSSRTPVPSSG